jgi:hypothetical protein
MQSHAINLSVLISMISYASYWGPLFPYIKKTPSRPLIFLWIFTRGYYAERNNKQIVNLSEEELGVIKTIKVCASFIWERCRPRSNVVRLEDLRE